MMKNKSLPHYYHMKAPFDRFYVQISLHSSSIDVYDELVVNAELQVPLVLIHFLSRLHTVQKK